MNENPGFRSVANREKYGTRDPGLQCPFFSCCVSNPVRKTPRRFRLICSVLALAHTRSIALRAPPEHLSRTYLGFATPSTNSGNRIRPTVALPPFGRDVRRPAVGFTPTVHGPQSIFPECRSHERPPNSFANFEFSNFSFQPTLPAESVWTNPLCRYIISERFPTW